MTAIRYRDATLDDVPALAALRESSGWTGGAPEARMRAYLAGAHHPQHARAPRAVIVAESDGAPVGFVAGHLTTRFGCDGELQWILVAPAHRGGSIASALLARLAEWFLRYEARRVCVDVDPENARARRFHARHGAASLSTHWMAWADVSTALRGGHASDVRPPDDT